MYALERYLKDLVALIRNVCYQVFQFFFLTNNDKLHSEGFDIRTFKLK